MSATFRRIALLPVLISAILAGCSRASPKIAHTVPSKIDPGVVRIMTLGDSITRGSGSGYGNYRRPLQALLTRAGYTFVFTGTNTEQSFNYHGQDPEQTFNPYQPAHEGYGLLRIDQISGDTPATDDGGVVYPGLSQTFAANQPDVVLLMLGANDVWQSYDRGEPGFNGKSGFAADAAQRLDTMVDRIYEAGPNIKLALATITPFGNPEKDVMVRDFNAFVPQIVARHKKLGQKIELADMYAKVTPRDLSPDGVHPGTMGYNKIARVWFDALSARVLPPVSKTNAQAK